MKTMIKVLLTMAWLIIAAEVTTAQVSVVKKDTVSVAVNSGNEDDDNKKGKSNSSSAASQSNAKKVKEVKSGKPDFSKSKGARPPSVVRPAGSRIPAGVGKPKGVKHGSK